MGTKLVAALQFLLVTPTSFLSTIKENWGGLVALGLAMTIGWVGHSKFAPIVNEPEVRERQVTTLQESDSLQWVAISGMISAVNKMAENQRILLCDTEIAEDRYCGDRATRPVAPLPPTPDVP